MAYLLKSSEMQTAPLDDLRITKKRSDRLRNFLCGLAVFSIGGVIILLLSQELFLGGAITTLLFGSATSVLLNLLMVIAGIISVLLIVLLKEENKYFVPAMIATGVSGVLFVMCGIIIGGIASTVGIAVMPLLRYLGIYNDKLRQIKGYPYFTHHDEHRKFEGTTRAQILESLKTGGIVDAEEFFGTDIKSFRQNEEAKDIPDKTEWLES